MDQIRKYWPYLILLLGGMLSVLVAFISIQNFGGDKTPTSTSTPTTVVQKKSGGSFFDIFTKLTDLSGIAPRLPNFTPPPPRYYGHPNPTPPTTNPPSPVSPGPTPPPDWVSPYYKQLTISGLAAGETDPYFEHLTITASNQNKEPILITGFTLKSTVTGSQASIGDGVELDFQIQPNVKQPIFLKPGSTAYVITGKARSGYSFEVNKCSGYLGQYFNFYPGITWQCPFITKADLPKPPNQLNDDCLDYLNKLKICTEYKKFPTNLTPECRNFVMDNLSYDTCITRHKNDADFFTGEWRIYLGRDQELWKTRRETIELYDREGKTVARRSY